MSVMKTIYNSPFPDMQTLARSENGYFQQYNIRSKFLGKDFPSPVPKDLWMRRGHCRGHVLGFVESLLDAADGLVRRPPDPEQLFLALRVVHEVFPHRTTSDRLRRLSLFLHLLVLQAGRENRLASDGVPQQKDLLFYQLFWKEVGLRCPWALRAETFLRNCADKLV